VTLTGTIQARGLRGAQRSIPPTISASRGLAPWDAVVEATRHRMRPILLTAAAVSLGMIPIAREVFRGPMAYAMIGGIIVGTVLTLVFLPALYVAWYRIEAPDERSAAA
jgi:multidrug efflux pump subunit AcrB